MHAPQVGERLVSEFYATCTSWGPPYPRYSVVRNGKHSAFKSSLQGGYLLPKDLRGEEPGPSSRS